MEKEHWAKFTAVHSPATAAHVLSVIGTSVSEEDFVAMHKQTCSSKRVSARVCGRDLYKFLRKYSYLN